MSASVAASVVGIAAGVNSLTGGGITNALGMGPSGGGGGGGGTSSGQYDPYGQYRGQAATQLNTLMNNPSSVMAQPGYQQQLQQGTAASQAGAAATGTLQSGAQQAALQNLGQSTFSSFYNSQLANLMQLSGASQSPAAAGMAQQQAATAAQNRQLQGAGTLMSGMSTLGGLFKGSATTDPYGGNFGSTSPYVMGGGQTPGWSDPYASMPSYTNQSSTGGNYGSGTGGFE